MASLGKHCQPRLDRLLLYLQLTEEEASYNVALRSGSFTVAAKSVQNYHVLLTAVFIRFQRRLAGCDRFGDTPEIELCPGILRLPSASSILRVLHASSAALPGRQCRR